LALDKKTWAKQDFQPFSDMIENDLNPEKATDGDYCEEGTSACCQVTSFLYEPWLTVDLEKAQVIRQINFFIPRGKESSVHGAEIRVGNHSDFLDNAVVGHVGNSLEHALGRAYVGRYLTIFIRQKFEELYLCEVEVLEDWQINPYKGPPMAPNKSANDDFLASMISSDPDSDYQSYDVIENSGDDPIDDNDDDDISGFLRRKKSKLPLRKKSSNQRKI